MSSLLERISELSAPRVLVIGDVMLDELVFGDAERLSPDAPVPVLEIRSREWRPGGAANVARCLVTMDCSVACLGAVGDDDAGWRLRELLEGDGIDVADLQVCPGRPTTVKRSLVGLAQHRHPQKMFRLDEETRMPLPSEEADALLAALAARLATTDVVCIEDYDKGVLDETTCRRVIEQCRDAGVAVLVDPAGRDDYARYAGATAITPNRSEGERAVARRLDETNLVKEGKSLAEELRAALDLEVAIVTLDRHGAVLAQRDSDPLHVPTRARSVYDVTGAGDVVLAAIATGCGGGLSWTECVELANVAAGLEVEVFGATAISLAQVQRALLGAGDDKVRDAEALSIELEVHRQAGRTIVLTNGCFDVIHAGHVAYLREAASLGDVLIVGVNGDDEVRRLKGDDRPIYPLAQRLEILSELRCVDLLVSFTEPTAEQLVRSVQPDLYVKGGDYARGDITEAAVLEELGIEVRVLELRPGLGSSSVIERLRGRGEG